MPKTNKKAESIPVNSKYGAWQVLALSSKLDYLSCQCDCGTIKDVNVYSLTSGKSRSCGCKIIEHMQETIKKRNA